MIVDPHPLEDITPQLYNPVTGQIAPEHVNVANSSEIGEKLEKAYVAGLPGGFFLIDVIRCPCKAMDNKCSKETLEEDGENE
ncbi:hypothetical protein DPMN_064914 [Dreissena polymorpha]|uniref:Uncharacterized protein n=1 Tax=Dreissena polymorpha TaxID=45954 RepID=A0A9D4CE74_DREPO|nr:hypothetical protein DPMN_064914 [Dreissena polymorpha]